MKKILHNFLYSSLKNKLLVAFIFTSILPSFVIVILSYIRISHTVKNNADELVHANTMQTKNSLNVWVDSYEDILFQIYMNDDIVEMVKDINENNDISTMTKQLRRTLRGMFYAKEYIQCITVITDSGRVVFYDMLTGSATQTSWIGNFGMTTQQIYTSINVSNSTRIIPTKKAGVYASKTYYMFHLGHRIIDFKNVNQPLGVVIVSIDEDMLQEMAGSDDKNSINFLVDTNGEMISCSNKKIIGNQIIKWSENLKERKKAYGEFINNSKIIDTKAYTIDVVYDESFQADIVHVAIQEDLISKMNEQQKIMILLLGVITLVLATMIYTVTRNLMSSINHLVDTMKVAGHGKLSVRAIENPKSPTEIQILETNFNSMLDKLESSIKNEKEASMKQKNAEIKALEAQINPHFLYNSLDTINWMAIDRDDYEISNAITALATILRYGIDHSNDVVELGREVEWLKQYLFLQQTRLKNTFECEINISEETKSFKIHKLLFQPFVENSILHGFEAKKSLYTLKIRIAMKNDNLVIQIWDNGKGMPVDLVERMNQGVFLENKDRQCIGMENAITRLKMYYGEEATVFISSQLGEYTNVIIQIPGQ